MTNKTMMMAILAAAFVGGAAVACAAPIPEESTSQSESALAVAIDEDLVAAAQCRQINDDPHWLDKYCSGGASSSYSDYTIDCSKECKSSTASGKYKCESTSRATFNPRAKCE